MRRHLVLLLLFALPTWAAGQAGPGQSLRLSEIVADPQLDHNGDGAVTGSDELVELVNLGPAEVDLSGWRLWLNDTTSTWANLEGRVPSGARWVLLNPPGDLNNNAHVALLDPAGRIVDEVRYGTWPSTTPNAPAATARGALDESLRRVNGAWAKGHATPGGANDEPAWILSDLFGRQGPDWVAPDTHAAVAARVLDSIDAIERLHLVADDGNASRLVAQWSIQPPAADLSQSYVLDSGRAPFAYAWEAETARGAFRSAWIEVRVDATPPEVREPPSVVWQNGTGPIEVVPATDAGVGGVRHQWRTTMNGTEATSEWSSGAALEPPASLADGTFVDARLRAQDAYGNTSPWTAPMRVGRDATPPRWTGPFWGAGDGPFELRWTPAADDASGLDHYELRRSAETLPAAWTLGPQETGFRDDWKPDGRPVAYELVAVDAAHNRGPPLRAEVDYEALHPHVAGIRVLRDPWRGGTQEIRIDFDRRMDPSSPVGVRLAGPRTVPLAGRYFVNASTYFVVIDDPGLVPDGAWRVVVDQARSEDGIPMVRPAGTSFEADRTDPVIFLSPGGWTNASQADVRVEDASRRGLSVSWTLAPADDGAPRGGNDDRRAFPVELPEDGTWTLRVEATDAAGNSAKARAIHRIDRQAPTAGPVQLVDGRAGSRWEIPLEDGGSGINWSSVQPTSPLPRGWTFRPDPSRHAVVVRPDGDVGAATELRLEAQDLARNRVEVRVVLGRAPPANPSPSSVLPGPRPASENESLAGPVPGFPETAAGGRPAPRGAPHVAWFPWAASLLGALGLAAPLARRGPRRRRVRRARSFAERVRAARARDGPTA